MKKVLSCMLIGVSTLTLSACAATKPAEGPEKISYILQQDKNEVIEQIKDDFIQATEFQKENYGGVFEEAAGIKNTFTIDLESPETGDIYGKIDVEAYAETEGMSVNKTIEENIKSLEFEINLGAEFSIANAVDVEDMAVSADTTVIMQDGVMYAKLNAIDLSQIPDLPPEAQFAVGLYTNKWMKLDIVKASQIDPFLGEIMGKTLEEIAKEDPELEAAFLQFSDSLFNQDRILEIQEKLIVKYLDSVWKEHDLFTIGEGNETDTEYELLITEENVKNLVIAHLEFARDNQELIYDYMLTVSPTIQSELPTKEEWKAELNEDIEDVKNESIPNYENIVVNGIFSDDHVEKLSFQDVFEEASSKIEFALDYIRKGEYNNELTGEVNITEGEDVYNIPFSMISTDKENGIFSLKLDGKQAAGLEMTGEASAKVENAYTEDHIADFALTLDLANLPENNEGISGVQTELQATGNTETAEVNGKLILQPEGIGEANLKLNVTEDALTFSLVGDMIAVEPLVDESADVPNDSVVRKVDIKNELTAIVEKKEIVVPEDAQDLGELIGL